MENSLMTILTWVGIVFCISQSAIFSGMNLALFSISRLRLEVEASSGEKNAEKLLRLREDSNFILTTVLWGNVGINVLLTLLSNSVLAGVSAFLFSTILITFVGEILPQAYFSRHALKMVSILAPVLKCYQYLLYPFAKPSAKFLAIDDLLVTQEGETLDPMSIIALPTENDQLVFPTYKQEASDPFLREIQKSGKKWVVLTNEDHVPLLVLDADCFLRHALFKFPPPDPSWYCHYPIIIENPSTKLGNILHLLKVHGVQPQDDVIYQDIVLLWGASKRIITGPDILGRLMRGISKKELVKNQK
ncbi:MAG: CNNM domain-containing protein [Deltaproteobacteria bacterium]|jgi:metal transporter CNNM|nr:CNNM domain-containing protein [Deltaproteobacteria bacterium]